MAVVNYIARVGAKGLLNPAGITALGKVALDYRKSDPYYAIKEKELEAKKSISTNKSNDKKSKLDHDYRLRELELKYYDKANKRAKKTERYLAKYNYKQKKLDMINGLKENRRFSLIEYQKEFTMKQFFNNLKNSVRKEGIYNNRSKRARALREARVNINKYLEDDSSRHAIISRNRLYEKAKSIADSNKTSSKNSMIGRFIRNRKIRNLGKNTIDIL